MANKRDAFDILASELPKIQREIATDVLRDINDGKTVVSVMGSAVVYHRRRTNLKAPAAQENIFVKVKRVLLKA